MSAEEKHYVRPSASASVRSEGEGERAGQARLTNKLRWEGEQMARTSFEWCALPFVSSAAATLFLLASLGGDEERASSPLEGLIPFHTCQTRYTCSLLLYLVSMRDKKRLGTKTITIKYETIFGGER